MSFGSCDGGYSFGSIGTAVQSSRRHRKTCTNLTLEDLTADTIRRFLDHLEQVRHNSVPTRNLRLAAIHSFFQYLATVDPRHLLTVNLSLRFRSNAALTAFRNTWNARKSKASSLRSIVRRY
jgi:site-specific recombinase XerD